MAYAEGALLLCTTVTILAIRSGRWWWAAAAGLVAGAVRPVGLLLIVPVVIEKRTAVAERRGRSRRSASRLAAVIAPAVGVGGYIWPARSAAPSGTPSSRSASRISPGTGE